MTTELDGGAKVLAYRLLDLLFGQWQNDRPRCLATNIGPSLGEFAEPVAVLLGQYFDLGAQECLQLLGQRSR